MGVDTVHNSLETLDNHMQQAKGSLRSTTESTEGILQQSRELVSTMSKFQLGDRAETKFAQNSSLYEFSAAEKNVLTFRQQALGSLTTSTSFSPGGCRVMEKFPAEVRRRLKPR